MAHAAALPDLGRAALGTGTSHLGLALTDAQLQALADFCMLLARWNRVHNLTAIRDEGRILTHHLLDSLALVRPLQGVLGKDAVIGARVLDVGSGGGLPGIPLAIACPHLQVTLVDAVQKKAAFLTQAVLQLRLPNVRVIHARVEELGGEYDVITSRAFAALADFVTWTQHLLAPGGVWLAMKGRIDAGEVAALPATVSVVAVHRLAVPGLDEERHLLEIRRK
jgi:16S rRNA (guanine527-N7)-methyltransferase